MPSFPIPQDEKERLLKLHAYEILYTPTEHHFDKIALLAAQLFNTPMAQITFVDEQHVFFKSNIGQLHTTKMERNTSFCPLAILKEEVTLIEDTLFIPELTNHPLVTKDNGIRFYAGAPLKTSEGFRLGTLCVLDAHPRTASPEQLTMLETLSSIIMDELELRLASRKAIRIQNDLLNRIAHDLKNPNTTIALSAELIKRKSNDPKIVVDFANRISQSTDLALTRLNNLLDLSRVENVDHHLHLEDIKISDILRKAIENFKILASLKQQHIVFNTQYDSTIMVDAKRIQEAFENLLSNAIKFSNKGTTILVNVLAEEDGVKIEVKDKGVGLTEHDMPKLFVKFAKLSANPTNKEYSNGVGLSMVKMLIELHKGKVWAHSEGTNKGASFFIFLPF